MSGPATRGPEARSTHDDFIASHGDQVSDAQHRIRAWVRRTPLLETDLGPELLLKAESLQVTGSFKPRGAFNAMLRLREREPGVSGVCTVSSGNHAQAVAYAARTLGLRAVIVIPQSANPLKIAATRSLGAAVITEGVTFDNREDVVHEVAQREGLPIVHPFEDWDVIHGQATAACEVLEERQEVATILTPVGGGGLLAGTALAVRSRSPGVRVIGVEPALADDAARSFRNNCHEHLDATPATIADGVKVLSIGERAYEVLVERRLVDDIVTVSEAELREAVRRVWLEARVLIEPTSALPIAAWLAGRVPRGTADAPTVAVVSGGNVDPALVASILTTAPASV